MTLREQLEKDLDVIREYRCLAICGEKTPCMYPPHEAAIYWKGQIIRLQTTLRLLDD